MIQILARVKIEDLAKFVSVFATRGAALRREFGSRAARLYKVSEQADQVVVLFDWESRADFERFFADQTVKDTMKSGGAMTVRLMGVEGRPSAAPSSALATARLPTSISVTIRPIWRQPAMAALIGPVRRIVMRTSMLI
jgi:heme-degrading monooxygenase HmoA